MNEYQKLKQRCREIGTSLSEICRIANVDRKTIQRWKTNEPKSITVLRQLEEVLNQKTK